MSMPITRFAPAFDANIERIPVPQPTCKRISFYSRSDLLLEADLTRRKQSTLEETDVEHNLPFKQMLVLHDRITVR